MALVSRRQSIRMFSSTLAGSALARSVPRAQSPFRFGDAAITWGGNDRQAITDIADVGFRGIQLRTAAVNAFGDRPGELKGLLDERGLTLVALSSGTLGIEAARAGEEIALHLKHARFLQAGTRTRHSPTWL